MNYFFSNLLKTLGLVVVWGLAGGCGGGGVSVGTGNEDTKTTVPGGTDPDEDIAGLPVIVVDNMQPTSVSFWLVEDGVIGTTQKNGNTNNSNNGNVNGNHNANNAAPQNTMYDLALHTADLYLTGIALETTASYICEPEESSGASGYLYPECTSGQVSFSGTWRADLIDGLFLPDIAGLFLPATTYTRLWLMLEDDKPFNVVLAGRASRYDVSNEHVLTSDAVVDFRVALALPGDIRIRPDRSAIEIAADKLNFIGMVVSRSRWFEGVPEDIFNCAESKHAVYDEEGVLHISDARGGGVCSAILGTLRSNFSSAARLSEY